MKSQRAYKHKVQTDSGKPGKTVNFENSGYIQGISSITWYNSEGYL